MRPPHCHPLRGPTPLGGPVKRYHAPNSADDLLLSTVCTAFLKAGHMRHGSKYEESVRSVFRDAIRVLGDRNFSQLTAWDVSKLVSACLKRGLSPSGTKYHIDVLHAAVRFYCTDENFNFKNPFNRTKIAGTNLGRPSKNHIGPNEIDDLKRDCINQDDEIRWMLALLIDTGARSSEIAGLALQDLRINDAIPHLIIEPKSWRLLKSKNSPRKIPLVGISNWAARRLLFEADPKQIYAFPRYIRDGKLTETHHKTLGAWLRSRHYNFGAHDLRVSFTNRLREAGCDEEARAHLLGIKKNWIYGSYGYGYGLEFLRERMSALDTTPSESSRRNTWGYDRILSPNQCASIIGTLISDKGAVNFKSIAKARVLDLPDVIRGIRHAKRQSYISFISDMTNGGAYVLTGNALLFTKSSAKARRRSRSQTIPRRIRRPACIMSPLPKLPQKNAGCFPPNSAQEPWHLRRHEKLLSHARGGV